MKIIDMRLRPPIPAWIDGPTFRTAMYFPRKIPNLPGARSAWDEDLDELFVEMDRASITKGVVIGRASVGAGNLGGVTNQAIVDCVDQYSDRFVGFLGVDLEAIDESLAEIRKMHSHPNIKGVSIEPGSGKVARYSDDDSLTPIYELCIELGLPVSISLSGLLSALGGHDISWCDPISVQRAAMKFPELTIIVSHAAYPFAVEMVTVAMYCENIYVSPDLYIATKNMPGSTPYIEAANLFLEDRMLFGTAYPTRPLGDCVRDFMEMGWRPEIIDKILYGNAAKLLGIDD
jgi:predicted TIM-barrel fold metal-dependent hydrolase